MKWLTCGLRAASPRAPARLEGLARSMVAGRRGLPRAQAIPESAHKHSDALGGQDSREHRRWQTVQDLPAQTPPQESEAAQTDPDQGHGGRLG